MASSRIGSEGPVSRAPTRKSAHTEDGSPSPDRILEADLEQKHVLPPEDGDGDSYQLAPLESADAPANSAVASDPSQKAGVAEPANPTDSKKTNPTDAKKTNPTDAKKTNPTDAEKAKPADAETAEPKAEADKADPQADDFDHADLQSGRRFLFFTAMPSWLVSLLVHSLGIIILALVSLPQPVETIRSLLTVEEALSDEIQDLPIPEDLPQELTLTQNPTMDSTLEPIPMQTELEVDPVAVANDVDMAATKIDFNSFSDLTAPANDLVRDIGAALGSGLSGRGPAERGRMVREFGGTEESEAAVALALKWIAHHQLPDGGWSFDHTIGPGVRLSPNPGGLRMARNGATAMALLPFLGAGQTHLEGEYKEVVKNGLLFLISQMQANGSLHESGGSMYSHGLCAITLCEAYAMTNDRDLMRPAQMSLNFIIYAQDPVGGGWRYNPRTPGDTSVVGWQLMALKSGHMAYLQVPPVTILGTSRFLDSVQTENGAAYGYTSPANGPGTSAVGLLCRMYLGWNQDTPALVEGVEKLARRGPSNNDYYYNYYATQVMRHFGGDAWTQWNNRMRDHYVKSQSTEGPTTGSWYQRGDHGADRGGRLYCTSMATMVLEVYYRHMPLYGKAASEEDFPLD